MPDLDLVVWGATGFTGRLVTRHVASRVATRESPGLRWAIGGRDRSKLERLRTEVAARPEVVTADALDADAMDALARRTRVVVSTVGPYALYGTPLVEACVRHGVDYCDIAAEPQWIRANIDRLHEQAGEKRSRIVHGCGFDSIPSDLGVWTLRDHLRRERPAARLVRADLYVTKIRGGLSGGTFASMLRLLDEASRDRDLRRLLADPYSLNPEGERRGPDGRDPTGARYVEDLGRWTAPFIMAGINTRVVRRTNALLGYPYGRDFRYGEAVVAGGRIRATLLSAAIAAFVVGGYLGPTRALMRRLLPAPGQGPSAEALRSGFFKILLRGRIDPESARPRPGPSERVVDLEIAGDRDPGYALTAVMLAESALCLVDDAPTSDGGVLTPAAAMARPLLDRLRAAGMRFDVRAGRATSDAGR